MPKHARLPEGASERPMSISYDGGVSDLEYLIENTALRNRYQLSKTSPLQVKKRLDLLSRHFVPVT